MTRSMLWCAMVCACGGAAAMGGAGPAGLGLDTLPHPRRELAAPPHDPISAVQGLVTRLLGAAYLPAFSFVVIPPDPGTGGNDVFELDASGSTVVVRGNTGVSLSAGVHWYLKYWCNASISWGRNGSGNQLGTVPPPNALPLPSSTQRIVSPVKYRYYYNVCTFGYTTAFWNASMWQAEIDRMALWGINLPLGFVGQEDVFLHLYTSPAINLTASDVQAYFSGPAFLPWMRMGNMQAWGGPLRTDWITARAALQVQLLTAMRSFGMQPVLPGFAGHVPAALVARFPNASFTKSPDWGGFNSSFGSVYLLEPTDPLFATIGSQFYSTLISTYGTDHFYNADMFNEMDPQSNNPTYLSAANAAMFQSMTSVDPQAVYVMQGWLFVNSPGFWGPQQVQAFLDPIPDDRMLILDLFTDSVPVWNRFDSFYGKPFVWNMLQVFGGRRGIYGNLPLLAQSIVQTRLAPNSTMVGIGATPEAVDISPVTFDLLWDMGWRSTSPDLPAWLTAYAQRRYGAVSPSINAAMAILLNATWSLAYGYGTTQSFCWLENDPGLVRSDHDGTDPVGVVQAFRLFVQAGQNGEVDPTLGPYQYDLVDLGRQVLCNVFADISNVMGMEYRRFQFNNVNSSASVLPTYAAMLQLITDLDALLATNPNYLLGTWIADAKQWAVAGDDAAWLEFNARNQITLWGPNGEINDYAAKNGWSGLVASYYGGRWSLHHDFIVSSVLTGQQVNWDAYGANLTAFKQGWGVDTTPFPTAPSGDGLAHAAAVVGKYATADRSQYTFHANTDAVGTSVDIIQAWNTDVDTMMVVCNLDPACLGFNLDGWMKNDTSNLVPSGLTSLWLKNSAAAAA